MALIKFSDVLCDDFDLFFCFIQASCVLLSCGLSSFDGHPAVIHARNNFARVDSLMKYLLDKMVTIVFQFKKM